MIGRMTLREVREAMAAAKASGAKGSVTAPTIQELESLARLLERELEAGARTEAPRSGGQLNKALVRMAVMHRGQRELGDSARAQVARLR
jgi:hypothetical protein